MTYEIYRTNGAPFAVAAPGPRIVCHMETELWSVAEVEAHAALIAAGPALLDVLPRFATYDYGKDGYCFCKYPPKFIGAGHSTKCNQARAALKLAKGES